MDIKKEYERVTALQKRANLISIIVLVIVFIAGVVALYMNGGAKSTADFTLMSVWVVLYVSRTILLYHLKSKRYELMKQMEE